MPLFQTRPKPVVLCILDGWGISEESEGNAILQANTPFWDGLLAHYPHAALMTSGLDVGLPQGQMGNSEVGHMNIGSGRIVMQELPRIDQAIASGSLAKSPELLSFIAALKKSGGVCHLMGVLSDGGVHAHGRHIAALAAIISSHHIEVAIHAFLDGRDTSPSSAQRFVEEFLRDIAPHKRVRLATLSGRYYAMDRDNRWDRISKAYEAMVSAQGGKADSAQQAIRESYGQKITDEFILPTVIGDYAGMHDGDGVVMANFRSDRAREILMALVDPAFRGFVRSKTVAFAARLGMVEYSTELSEFIPAIFRAEKMTGILGQIISERGMKQLRIAETEKYAHVTFFFSGGREQEFSGEERILVPSPKVVTYDQQPEMSAFEVTDKLLTAIGSGDYDLIVVNFANSDMVGHTGNIAAAIKAVEALDKCLAKLIPAVNNAGGVTLITADHGNSEKMVDHESGQPHTAHTMGPVPLVLAGGNVAGRTLMNGRLCDIAPTILRIMDIEQPPQMTGKSLIQ